MLASKPDSTATLHTCVYFVNDWSYCWVYWELISCKSRLCTLISIIISQITLLETSNRGLSVLIYTTFCIYEGRMFESLGAHHGQVYCFLRGDATLCISKFACHNSYVQENSWEFCVRFLPWFVGIFTVLYWNRVLPGTCGPPLKGKKVQPMLSSSDPASAPYSDVWRCIWYVEKPTPVPRWISTGEAPSRPPPRAR